MSDEDKGILFSSSALVVRSPLRKFAHVYIEQLRQGTAKVREVLGPDVLYTEKEIQDSLWHYYYDVGKTVNYLLSNSATLHRSSTPLTRLRPEIYIST